MSSLPYVNVASRFTKYGVFLTVISNSLLLHLTFWYVKNIAFPYKCLIGIQAILGILFAMTEVLVHPFLHSFNASYIFFSVDFASEEWMTLGTGLLGLYSWIYMNIICWLAIQFIFRYFLVVTPKSLSVFRGWKVLIWLTYTLLFTALWVYSLVQIAPDEESREYLKKEMETNYEVDIRYLSSYQAVVYDTTGNVNSKAVQGVLGFSTAILVQYLIILHCGVYIHLGIKKTMTTTSSRTHKLHRQLFKTLVLQVTIPSIFYNSPVLLLYIIMFLDLKWSMPSGVMICVISFYPAFDSLILMWMVADYNVSMKRLLYKILSRIEQVLKSSDSDDDDDDNDGQSKTKKSTVTLANRV